MTTTEPTTSTETTITKTAVTSIVSKVETATVPKVDMVTAPKDDDCIPASDKTNAAECAPDVPSADDGGSGNENGDDDADPTGDISLLGAPDIGRALNSAGRVVTVVVLLCGDGTADATVETVETRIDTTPKMAEVRRLLLDGVAGAGGKGAGDRSGPSFVGQYEEEDVMVVCLNQQHPHTASLPLNPHVLVPPLDGVPVRGNMVVMRVGHDADATPGDYTQGQFVDFLAKRKAAVADGSYVVAAQTTVEGEDEEGDEDEDGDDEIADVDDEDGEDDEEDDEDEEDEEDDEDEDEGEFNSEDMIEMLMAQVVRKHRLQNDGEDPTEEQLETFKRVILEKFGIAEDAGEGEEAEEGDGGEAEEGGEGEQHGAAEKAAAPLPQALPDDPRDAKRDAAAADVDAGTVTAAGDAKRVRVSD